MTEDNASPKYRGTIFNTFLMNGWPDGGHKQVETQLDSSLKQHRINLFSATTMLCCPSTPYLLEKNGILRRAFEEGRAKVLIAHDSNGFDEVHARLGERGSTALVGRSASEIRHVAAKLKELVKGEHRVEVPHILLLNARTQIARHYMFNVALPALELLNIPPESLARLEASFRNQLRDFNMVDGTWWVRATSCDPEALEPYQWLFTTWGKEVHELANMHVSRLCSDHGPPAPSGSQGVSPIMPDVPCGAYTFPPGFLAGIDGAKVETTSEETPTIMWVESMDRAGKPTEPEPRAADSYDRVSITRVLEQAEFDIIIYEPANKLFFLDRLDDGASGYRRLLISAPPRPLSKSKRRRTWLPTPMQRGMLFLLIEHIGDAISHQDVRDLFGTTRTTLDANAMYQYPRSLRRVLGRRLSSKLVMSGVDEGNPIKRVGWSFLWIRHAHAKTRLESELISGRKRTSA